MKTVQIANPQPGGQTYTSTKRADQFIRRGIAVMINGRLNFVTSTTSEIRQIRLREKQLREAAGMCYWNGAVKEEWAMKRPGEVRS